MNPLSSVGTVGVVRMERRHGSAVEEMDDLGSCFTFRQHTHFLTARHCIPDDESLGRLIMPGAPDPIPFASVEHHPNADLTLITIDGDALGYKAYWEPFWDFVSNWQVGEEFMAYGYPIDTIWADDNPRLTPRLFRGSYQRFWHHRTAGGRFNYLAGEMSIPAPRGLSGGPLFRPSALPMLTGMVVETIDSTTYTDEVVERTKDGKTERTTLKRLVSYGVAVVLSDLASWLNDRVPAHQTERPEPPSFAPSS